jgi:acetyl-CoA carboxylase biotin carboxyl carrier protein
MNIKEVKDLIQEILRSDISEFELEHTGTRVRLRRGIAHQGAAAAPEAHAGLKTPAAGREAVFSSSAVFGPPMSAKEEAPAEDDLHYITSPIVGTFFRSPVSGTEPYVTIGSKVEVGAMLCIVEAMKLMNEIPSDVAGEVVEIFPENGQPVEFGQKLFAIRPRK